MKTSEGFTVRPNHIPSSTGDFGTLSVEMSGSLAFRVMPLSADDLRQLAGELLTCAASLDAAHADAARMSDIFEAMAADEREAA